MHRCLCWAAILGQGIFLSSRVLARVNPVYLHVAACSIREASMQCTSLSACAFKMSVRRSPSILCSHISQLCEAPPGDKADHIMGQFGIKDEELENIFDLIAKDNPDL